MGRPGIVAIDDIGVAGHEAVLSVVFAEGMRPDAEAIASLATIAGDGLSFSISHQPDRSEGWVELLARGLTFDCRGLLPAEPAHTPLAGALVGLAQQPGGECISLTPAPHLASGKGLLPVVAVQAGIGARLAALPGALAVVWQPARSWMAPDYFARLMHDWQSGGAFPALGLTSLQFEANGAMVTHGLELLIGQELRIEAGHQMKAADLAKIAVRLIHQLVNDGPLEETTEIEGPGGERLLAVPVRDALQLRVMVNP